MLNPENKLDEISRPAIGTVDGYLGWRLSTGKVVFSGDGAALYWWLARCNRSLHEIGANCTSCGGGWGNPLTPACSACSGSGRTFTVSAVELFSWITPELRQMPDPDVSTFYNLPSSGSPTLTIKIQ